MTTSIRARTILVAIALSLPSAKAVWGQENAGRKLDKSLQQVVAQGCSGGPQAVIIRTKEGYRKGVGDSLRAHGDKVTGEFKTIDAVAAEVHCEDLTALARMFGTASISRNAPMDAHGAKPVRSESVSGRSKKQSTLTQEEAAGKLQAPMFQSVLAWSQLRAASYLGSTTTTTDNSLNRTLDMLKSMGLTGTAGGIGIGVIDSGIAPGVEFENRITAFYDFTQGDVQPATPSDGYGHGTHVAGLIAGRYVGVAPGARLIGLKVLDDHGRGATTDVLRAIEFAIANKAALNLHILNLSLGHPIYEPAATDPLVQAVEHAVREGFVVVVSAGNFGINKRTGEPGYAGIASPGNAPSALTVGATQIFDTVTRADDRVAPYSSRGPSWYDGFAKPDVVAPGDNLLSVAAVGSRLRDMQEQRGNTGEYMRLSGTSMAAGVTSGMAALVLEINPGLTPNALKAVVEYTAIPVSTQTGEWADALTQGTGQINGGGAATLAWMIDADALVGQPWLSTALTAPTTQIGDNSYTWAQSILWGNHRASGGNLMTEQRLAWARAIVWGDGLEDDDNIVWGNSDDDNIVWGNNIVWAADDDNIVWGNNIVWAANDDDNIVWGNNIVWGGDLIGVMDDDDNIVWGNSISDIVWGALDDDNIVWGNLLDDGYADAVSDDDDNIVWGNSLSEPSVSGGKGGKR